MSNMKQLAAVLCLMALAAQASAFDGASRSLLAPKCNKRNVACNLYNETTCCPNLMCSMPKECTETALGTQKCLPACIYEIKENSSFEVRRVRIGNYYAWETGVRSRPAVLVIQEWWGVNEAIKQTAEHLALQGYRTLIPDIYQGKVALEAAEARHLSSNLNWTVAIRQFNEAVKYLRKTGSPKVGVTGFCQGGGLAFCAAQFSNVDVAVPFYGLPNTTFCQPEKIKVPVHIHLGLNDTSIPVPRAEAVYNSIKNAGLVDDLELYLYPDTGHAFFNGLTPAGRNLTAGRLAPIKTVTDSFARLTAVLARYLKDQR